MVILPYRDLAWSSPLPPARDGVINKWFDRDDNEVGQGIAVYGNKGSTDQHAYVQQLRDGLDNFFVTFIEVLREREAGRPVVEVEPGTTSGDYLSGFLQGTRQALWERGRQSITLTIEQLDAKSLGMLIALYERAVGFYASLVNINAYHQPGVEAGKKAAQAILDLQAQVLMTLRSARGREMSVEDVATAAGATDLVAIFSILQHLVANGRGVTRKVPEGKTVTEAVYSAT
ncbi:MAG: hypothetical protein R3F14_39535 [Polyangiaceae bacterium]